MQDWSHYEGPVRTDAERLAYERGAREMQEMAAQRLLDMAKTRQGAKPDADILLSSAAQEVRALPIPPPGTSEGDK